MYFPFIVCQADYLAAYCLYVCYNIHLDLRGPNYIYFEIKTFSYKIYSYSNICCPFIFISA